MKKALFSCRHYLGNINSFVSGSKLFELTNHLGNVLVTVSYNKNCVDDGEYELICTSHYDPTTQMNYETCGVIQIAGEADGHIDYYSADVMTANDYYPSCILTVLVKTSL